MTIWLRILFQSISLFPKPERDNRSPQRDHELITFLEWCYVNYRYLVFSPAVHIQLLFQLLNMYGLISCILRVTSWLFSLNKNINLTQLSISHSADSLFTFARVCRDTRDRLQRLGITKSLLSSLFLSILALAFT